MFYKANALWSLMFCRWREHLNWTYKLNLPRINLLRIVVTQINNQARAMFRRSTWSPANFEVELSAPGKPWKERRSAKLKMTDSKKTLSQIRSTGGKSSGEHWCSMVLISNNNEDDHCVVWCHLSNMDRIRKQGDYWCSMASLKSRRVSLRRSFYLLLGSLFA